MFWKDEDKQIFGNILHLHQNHPRPFFFVAAHLDICAASQKYSGAR
jgi:hypothetical protein